jgi:hypothetical protein
MNNKKQNRSLNEKKTQFLFANVKIFFIFAVEIFNPTWEKLPRKCCAPG